MTIYRKSLKRKELLFWPELARALLPGEFGLTLLRLATENQERFLSLSLPRTSKLPGAQKPYTDLRTSFT